VGGRLSAFWEEWLRLGASPYVVRLLQEGYRLEFVERPNLTIFPVETSVPASREKFQNMQLLIHELLGKQAVERVRQPGSPGFYNRIFLVPKKEKGVWRLILDLSILNKFLTVETFKMETAESIRHSLRQDDWVTSLDLLDAYYHVLIHPRDRKFLRFAFQGQVFQFRALPMGLSASPRIFTRIIKCFKGFIQRQGIRFYLYLDDWLVQSQTRVVVARHTRFIIQLAQSLGFIINFKKSELTPTQDIVYLGYLFQLSQGLVRPPPARWDKIVRTLSPFRLAVQLPALTWQSAIGLLVSVVKLVPLGLLFLRPLQLSLSDQWSQFRGHQSDMVAVTHEVREAVAWWLQADNVLPGVPLNSNYLIQPQVLVFCDASQKGWGGHLQHSEVQGHWTPEEQALHINLKEMLAVIFTLEAFKDKVRQHTVLVHSDNTTTVAYIRHLGGTRSRSLFLLARRLHLWAKDNSVTLLCRHIPGKLNVLADGLSRDGQILPTEWSISDRVLVRLWTIWEKPHLDLFATRHNHKLPIYVSPVPDNQALDTDALSLSWDNLLGYAFPPTAILGKVLHKLALHTGVLILIAPRWPQQPWYTQLLELLIDLPLELPVFPRLLKQPQSDVYHHDPALFQLHAWRISGDLSKIRAFRQELLRRWRKPKSLQAERSTKGSGGSSQIGVLDGISIPCRLLSLQ
jgi:hypothetical protein